MGPFLTSETPWETGVCFVLTFGSILQITKHLMVEIHYNFHFSKIAESQNGLGLKALQRPSSPTSLQRAGIPSTRPGCTQSHPASPYFQRWELSFFFNFSFVCRSEGKPETLLGLGSSYPWEHSHKNQPLPALPVNNFIPIIRIKWGGSHIPSQTHNTKFLHRPTKYFTSYKFYCQNTLIIEPHLPSEERCTDLPGKI